MMETCIFCSIVKGFRPASVIYSDEKTLVFLDHRPVNQGHALVIPKAHAVGLSDLDSETGGHVFMTAMRVADALKRSGIKCEAVTLWLADGKAAHQEVMHVHLHVIPRFRGDEFGIRVGSSYGSKPEKSELDSVAKRIKNAMH